MASLFSPAAAIWSLGLGLVQPLLALKAIEAQVELATGGRRGRRSSTRRPSRSRSARCTIRWSPTAPRATCSPPRPIAATRSPRRTRSRSLRYDAGRTSFLEVIDAQRQLLAAETLRIAAARDAKLSIVDFAKALGGGWNPEQYAAAR